MRRYFPWLLALVLSACRAGSDSLESPQPSPAASPTAAAPTQEPIPTIAQPGPCEHLLWPLTDGALWRYQLARADGSAEEVTLRAAVSGDGAALALDRGGNLFECIFACQPDGLYGALPGLTGHPDLGAGLAITNPNRPFLPSADRLLPLGTEAAWDAEYDSVGGTLTLPMSDETVTVDVKGGRTVLYATAQPLETVSVPVGTFNALPVEQSFLFDWQVVTADGTPSTVFGDALVQLYWVEGVGLVRQVFAGGTLSGVVGDSPLAITLEADITLDLVEYHVPGK